MYFFALGQSFVLDKKFQWQIAFYPVVPVTLFRNCAAVRDHPRFAAEKIGNKRNVALWAVSL
jgi:hypothetical protein